MLTNLPTSYGPLSQSHSRQIRVREIQIRFPQSPTALEAQLHSRFRLVQALYWPTIPPFEPPVHVVP